MPPRKRRTIDASLDGCISACQIMERKMPTKSSLVLLIHRTGLAASYREKRRKQAAKESLSFACARKRIVPAKTGKPGEVAVGGVQYSAILDCQGGEMSIAN